MKFKLIEEVASEGHDVAFGCQVLGVSRGGYYKWLSRPLSTRRIESQRLWVRIKKMWEKSKKSYGAPRIHADLKGEGEKVSRKRVAKIMRENGVQGAGKKKFRPVTTNSNHSLPVAPRVLKVEDIEPSTLLPNQIWAGDITYVPTEEGFCYLAVLMDIGTRKIVGHSLSDSLHTQLVVNALDMAVGRQGPGQDLIIHTDRGSQYAAEAYLEKLKKNKFLPSMSRKGNCYDNAFVESFFRSLKVELVYTRKFKNSEEARKEIFEYIEVWYNRQRRHSSLAYMTPIDYEQKRARVS